MTKARATYVMYKIRGNFERLVGILGVESFKMMPGAIPVVDPAGHAGFFGILNDTHGIVKTHIETQRYLFNKIRYLSTLHESPWLC